jgi:hypothetical protein
LRSTAPVEKLFPNPNARKVADEAVDALPATEPMTTFLDVWEAAYFSVAKKSPFR